MRAKAIVFSFLLVILALFLYSFTQVDLSLTLSRASIFQLVEKNFQHIGYFNRPLSAAIYVFILLGMFGYYIYFLKQVIRKKINKKDIWILIIATAGILAFSYNAFSYDLFNYIFDAKIITHYHQNPYFHKALDYPGDPMLSFMQWTHRLYPYGPFWLVLTTPLSYIGMNIFLVTFFLFKFLLASFYLGSVYLISKITKKLWPEHELFSLVFFALNPLVIVECLVSSHNDIAMIFFALLGIYLFVIKNKILGILAIVLSAMVKIPSVVLLAPMLVSLLPVKKFSLTIEKLIWSFVALSTAGLFYSMTKLEIQPWYFLWVIPFVSLLKPNKYVVSLSIGISLGLLLRYLVFIYYGSWDGFALPLRNGLTIASVLILPTLVFLQDKFGRKLI